MLLEIWMKTWPYWRTPVSSMIPYMVRPIAGEISIFILDRFIVTW